MQFPADLLYTKEHEWIRFDGDTAIVGITDFAQSELGDIVFVEIETTGEQLNQDDVFGSIEAVKTVSDLFMPISGTVLEVNSALNDAPEMVNNDPYESGWLVKIKPSDLTEKDNLLNVDAYKTLIGL